MRYWLLGDHLGSSNVAYNINDGTNAKQRYAVWGAVRGGDNALPTDYTFTGQKLDMATGLLYYRARWYDPGLARWVQPDTIVPEPGDPQDLNRYSYTGNNPMTFNDPTGHMKSSYDDWGHDYPGGGTTTTGGGQATYPSPGTQQPGGASSSVPSRPAPATPTPSHHAAPYAWEDMFAMARMLYGEEKTEGDLIILSAGWVLRNRRDTGYSKLSYTAQVESSEFYATISVKAAYALEAAGDPTWNDMKSYAIQVLTGDRFDPACNPMVENPWAVFFANSKGPAQRDTYEVLLNTHPDPANPWVGEGYWGKIEGRNDNWFYYYGPRPGQHHNPLALP